MDFACWASGTWAAGSWVDGSWCPGGVTPPVVEAGGWYFPQTFIKPDDMDDDEFILLVTGVLLSE